MNGVGAGAGRRKSCERCRLQKLKCIQSNPKAVECDRCLRLNTTCIFSPTQRLGRPPKDGVSRRRRRVRKETTVATGGSISDLSSTLVDDEAKELEAHIVALQSTGIDMTYGLYSGDSALTPSTPRASEKPGALIKVSEVDVGYIKNRTVEQIPSLGQYIPPISSIFSSPQQFSSSPMYDLHSLPISKWKPEVLRSHHDKFTIVDKLEELTDRDFMEDFSKLNLSTASYVEATCSKDLPLSVLVCFSPHHKNIAESILTNLHIFLDRTEALSFRGQPDNGGFSFKLPTLLSRAINGDSDLSHVELNQFLSEDLLNLEDVSEKASQKRPPVSLPLLLTAASVYSQLLTLLTQVFTIIHRAISTSTIRDSDGKAILPTAEPIYFSEVIPYIADGNTQIRLFLSCIREFLDRADSALIAISDEQNILDLIRKRGQQRGDMQLLALITEIEQGLSNYPGQE